MRDDGQYRSIAYVRAEVESLAEQITKFASCPDIRRVRG
jgi:hypothetical protein